MGVSIESRSIKGAKVSVVNYPNPLVGVFTKQDLTTKWGGRLTLNRRWFYTEAIENENFPKELLGANYFILPVQEKLTYNVNSDGELFAVAPCNAKCDKTEDLKKIGFSRVESAKTFALFDKREENVCALFKRVVKKGDKFVTPRPWCIIAGVLAESPSENGEVLYNGITIPRQWPPRYEPNSSGEWYPDGKRPMPVPYLTKKPSVINISVGRQLFVDDFLIASGDFQREYHMPKKFEGNPILKPETPFEKGKYGINNMWGAAPKDGGIWWNPEKNIFELWYEAGWCGTYAYATSKDGINWERPDLGLFSEPNQIMPSNMHPDSGGVVRDYQCPDPNAQYKMINRGEGNSWWTARVWTSADGKKWGDFVRSGVMGDRSTMFYNPFRKKWVYSLRWDIFKSSAGRARSYMEVNDIVKGAAWLPEEPVYWLGTDNLDPMRPEIENSGKPQLYNFNAVAYESIMLGMFQIHWGPHNDICAEYGHPKYTGLSFGYSRDGFHFSRPDRRIAIDSSRTFSKWDNGYVQSVGGICTIHGDELYIYYIAFRGNKDKALDPKSEGFHSMKSGMYDNSAMGIAKLRRDGFASLNSKSPEEPAVILTEPLLFAGSYLFANIDAPKGALYAEVIDINGNVVQPYSFANCIPAKGDSTCKRIRWKGASGDLARFAQRPVRFRFKMENGKFYSFWVSVAENGRSDGYVAGGGKGFYSNIDTVGTDK